MDSLSKIISFKKSFSTGSTNRKVIFEMAFSCLTSDKIMKSIFIYLSLLFSLMIHINGHAQDINRASSSKSGWFSLGGRSTVSVFSQDGFGLGTGGQFRVQLSNSVNTDWFADYISVNISDKVRSEYYHIGWSVLFYPVEKQEYPKILQPYILAGHCFDFNRKTAIQDPSVSKSRWGSAVQAGLGTHFNLSEKFDVSITSQYMIHFTNDLEAQINGNRVTDIVNKNSTLEGHLLTTFSLNYKLFRLWKK